jgi:hypothetical protein
MAVRPEILQQKREALVAVLDEALRGTPRPLYNHLARNSSLPSPRANEALLTDFADMCGTRGKAVDALLETMATIDADYAQGGTEFEFVPMCGVAGIGARASAGDKDYPKLLELLHVAADDLRFKVRDTVPLALARIGASRGDVLVHEVAPFMDGLFHSAAVLRALAIPGWLTKINDSATTVLRLDQAFWLLDKAPRSASRYPGYKALVDAMMVTPGIVAARFGVPVFDAMVSWSKSTEPVLREAIEKNLVGSKLAGRHQVDMLRVREALDGSAPVRRDPLTYVGPTRRRGAPKGQKPR